MSHFSSRVLWSSCLLFVTMWTFQVSCRSKYKTAEYGDGKFVFLIRISNSSKFIFIGRYSIKNTPEVKVLKINIAGCEI